MNRRHFINRTTLITAAAAATSAELLGREKAAHPAFTLNYAPHFGMFKNSAPGGLLDELRVFVAPKLLGDHHARSAAHGIAKSAIADASRWALRLIEPFDEDVLLVYQRPLSDAVADDDAPDRGDQ